MIDSLVPPALLCGALGLVLAMAALRVAAAGAFVLALAALLSFLIAPLLVREPLGMLLGCWANTVACAIAVCGGRVRGAVGPLLLCAIAGVLAGGLIGVKGAPASDLLPCLPWVLICLPARWLAVDGRSIVLKIVASWIIAVSIFGFALPFAPVTLGYQPDHME